MFHFITLWKYSEPSAYKLILLSSVSCHTRRWCDVTQCCLPSNPKFLDLVIWITCPWTLKPSLRLPDTKTTSKQNDDALEHTCTLHNVLYFNIPESASTRYCPYRARKTCELNVHIPVNVGKGRQHKFEVIFFLQCRYIFLWGISYVMIQPINWLPQISFRNFILWRLSSRCYFCSMLFF